ncbi:MAG: hypothetical protein D6681_11015, partial [Calditrichaeota bacterium]
MIARCFLGRLPDLEIPLTDLSTPVCWKGSQFHPQYREIQPIWVVGIQFVGIVDPRYFPIQEGAISGREARNELERE